MPAGFDDDDADFDAPSPRDENAGDPEQRAREAVEQLRIHCELAAVFEGPRKYDAEVRPGLDAGVARDLQQAIGKLEKQKTAKLGPVLPPAALEAAKAVLDRPATDPSVELGVYHISRRPGETIIIRWLDAEDIERFYERFNAHFKAAHGQKLEDDRQELGWRQDEADQKYLEHFEKVEPQADLWYLRELLKKHGMIALSTTSVDEMDILHLCDTLMGVPAIDVVGRQSAPDPDDANPSHADRAWYFRLFNLRGPVNGVERMCIFAFLQKADDDLW